MVVQNQNAIAGADLSVRNIAESFAGLGIPAFACSPDKLPGLMAAAISRRDLGEWMGE